MPPVYKIFAWIHKLRKPELQIANISHTSQFDMSAVLGVYRISLWKWLKMYGLNLRWFPGPTFYLRFRFMSLTLCAHGFMTNTFIRSTWSFETDQPQLLNPRSQFILPMFLKILNPTKETPSRLAIKIWLYKDRHICASKVEESVDGSSWMTINPYLKDGGT